MSIVRLFSHLATTFFLSLALAQGASAAGSQIVLGVHENTHTLEYGTWIDETLYKLRTRYGTERFVVREGDTQELQDWIRNGELDFIISDADFFSRYDVSDQLKAIASMWPRGVNSPAEVVGSVFVTRADNPNIKTLDQMVRTSVAAVSQDSFTGWFIAMHEIKNHGYNPNNFFTKVSVYGYDYTELFKALEAGKNDVAIVPACVYERYGQTREIDAKKFRVIGKTRSVKGCAYSTSLYPGLYFSSTVNAGDALVKEIQDVISAPRRNGGVRWGRPASNRTVHDLMFELRIGPYSHLNRWQFENFVRENSVSVIIVLVVILMILFYSAIVSLVVRTKTSQLHQELAIREQMEKVADASRDRIASLERAGVVGMMSSMIAHELKQPLGAINNFANGMLRRAKRGEIDSAVLIDILEEIVNQGTRASDIVNRVRSYAKQKDPKLSVSDLSEPVNRAVETFRHSKKFTSKLVSIIPDDLLQAEIDAWEIEIAVYNLLKNAAESVQPFEDGKVFLKVESKDDFWRIEVKDNGPKIVQDDVDHFLGLFVSSKKDGLGMGLSIVSSIAERNKGHLSGIANADRGVTLMIDIPKYVPGADGEDTVGENVNLGD